MSLINFFVCREEVYVLRYKGRTTFSKGQGETIMTEFPSGEGFAKMLTESGLSGVTTVGYNNFAYMEPQQKPWVQKHYTLHFVLCGSGFLEMGGKRHFIIKHQIFIVPPNELMMYYPNPTDKWAYIWFCVNNKDIDVFFPGIEHPVLKTEYGSHIATVLLGLFNNGKFTDDYRITSVFYEILHCIIQPHSTRQTDIKYMIDRNYHLTEFTIEKLCCDCGLSHAQLCRVFFKAYGMQPKQYLIHRRMEYAKELLRQTDLKLDAVARSCGYGDSTHFMKEFKRREHITAGQYRKNNK